LRDDADRFFLREVVKADEGGVLEGGGLGGGELSDDGGPIEL
jgi:hypothetical protein